MTTEQKELALKWLQKAIEELKTGEEFYIPIDNRDFQKENLKVFKRELKALEQVDPITASSIHVYPTLKDSRFWIVLKKTSSTGTTGFKKDLSGKITKIELDGKDNRKRRVSLMLEDGLSWEEITEIEGDVSDLRKE